MRWQRGWWVFTKPNTPDVWDRVASGALLLGMAACTSIRRAHDGRGVLLHAAAIVRGSSLIVLPGHSGAGKSSLSLAAVDRGYGYLTDELLEDVIERDEAGR